MSPNMRNEVGDVHAERGPYGQWCVSAIVRGHLMQRQYYGHNRTNSILLFIAEARKENHE